MSMIRALDLQLRFPAATPITGWIIVFRWANHLSIASSHPGQLSLLHYVGREMSTDHSAVMLCGWGVVRYDSFHVWTNVWVAGKTV